MPEHLLEFGIYFGLHKKREMARNMQHILCVLSISTLSLLGTTMAMDGSIGIYKKYFGEHISNAVENKANVLETLVIDPSFTLSSIIGVLSSLLLGFKSWFLLGKII